MDVTKEDSELRDVIKRLAIQNNWNCVTDKIIDLLSSYGYSKTVAYLRENGFKLKQEIFDPNISPHAQFRLSNALGQDVTAKRMRKMLRKGKIIQYIDCLDMGMRPDPRHKGVTTYIKITDEEVAVISHENSELVWVTTLTKKRNYMPEPISETEFKKQLKNTKRQGKHPKIKRRRK